MTNFDPRTIKVFLQYGDEIREFNNLFVEASGRLFDGSIQSDANIKIANVSPELRDFVLTEGSIFLTGINSGNFPYIRLEVGRESYGTFNLYTGVIGYSNISNPPDAFISLTAFQNSVVTDTVSQSVPSVTLIESEGLSNRSEIAALVADEFDLALNYKAAETKVANFRAVGNQRDILSRLEDTGVTVAVRNNRELLVVDNNLATEESPIEISARTGMVGIPKLTAEGVNVTVLVHPSIRVFSYIEVMSERYPAANGVYFIYEINFEVANRNTPFYYHIKAQRFN